MTSKISTLKWTLLALYQNSKQMDLIRTNSKLDSSFQESYKKNF